MLIAYKAFDKDLKCRGYQFKLNEWNTEEYAQCVESGLHCATNPLDCLTYYSNFETSRLFIVACAGDIHEDGSDSKVSCTKMKLLKELNLIEFVAVSMQYILDHPKLKMNNKVYTDFNNGQINNGFVIVRGKNPKAKAPVGSVVGLIQENENNIEIKKMKIFKIDGTKYKENVIYDISEREYVTYDINEKEVV